MNAFFFFLPEVVRIICKMILLQFEKVISLKLPFIPDLERKLLLNRILEQNFHLCSYHIKAVRHVWLNNRCVGSKFGFINHWCWTCSFVSRWDQEKPASVSNLILLKFNEVSESISALAY